MNVATRIFQAMTGKADSTQQLTFQPRDAQDLHAAVLAAAHVQLEIALNRDDLNLARRQAAFERLRAAHAALQGPVE